MVKKKNTTTGEEIETSVLVPLEIKEINKEIDDNIEVLTETQLSEQIKVLDDKNIEIGNVDLSKLPLDLENNDFPIVSFLASPSFISRDELFSGISGYNIKQDALTILNREGIFTYDIKLKKIIDVSFVIALQLNDDSADTEQFSIILKNILRAFY